MVRIDVLVQKILTGICLGLLLFFLWRHYQLSITRYFDVDEFAHLSWTSHWAMGSKPYIDFLTFFPPGFMIILSPLFWLGNTGVFPIIAARFFMFLIYLGVLGSMGYLFYLMRRSWFWIVALVILVFLPLPKDKFIEIRPDSPATLLGLLGVIWQIRWWRNGKRRDAVISGIFHSTSLLVLPKMVPQVAIAVALAVISVILPISGGIMAIRGRKRILQKLLPFFIGLIIPAGIFGTWAISLGDISTVTYSLTKLPVEANKISEIFIMLPNLFFYPNGIFYGENGYSSGLKVNHLIWIIGLGMGAYRLVTPLLTKDIKYLWEELLISGIFYIHIIFYTLIVPLKHSQYLIPIAVFIAWYAADFAYILGLAACKHSIGLFIYLGGGVLASLILYQAYGAINQEKLSWTNTEALTYLQNLYKNIPTGEYILDLDGRTLYYPYPYYACCLPFGQSAPFLSRPLPSLAEALEKTKTKYIYQGELKRVDTLQREDQAYINAHYVPQNGDLQLLVRNQ